ncbi:hypothetical protein [Photobacterium sp. DNB22_13_2]
MKTIEYWLEELKKNVALNASWDESAVTQLLNEAPPTLFGEVVNPKRSEAIAYWLDVCRRLSLFHQKSGNFDLAFQYQQFYYSKIQMLATVPDQDPATQRWCVKKLEHMIVNMLELCQQHPHPNRQKQSKQLIDSHIFFMQQLSHQNLSFGPSIRQSH